MNPFLVILSFFPLCKRSTPLDISTHLDLASTLDLPARAVGISAGKKGGDTVLRQHPVLNKGYSRILEGFIGEIAFNW